MANPFECEIAKSAKALGVYYQKVALAQKGLVKLRLAPFDSFILSKQGKFIALELKSQKIYGSFPLGNIQDHQIKGLYDVLELGCRAYLLINQRREQRKNGKTKTNNRCWSINMKDWGRLIKGLNGRKSIPKELFDCNSGLLQPIPRVRVNGILLWDIRTII